MPMQIKWQGQDTIGHPMFFYEYLTGVFAFRATWSDKVTYIVFNLIYTWQTKSKLSQGTKALKDKKKTFDNY